MRREGEGGEVNLVRVNLVRRGGAYMAAVCKNNHTGRWFGGGLV